MTLDDSDYLFGPHGPTCAEFFARHWRVRPLRVPGGAQALLGDRFPLTAPAVARLVATFDREAPDQVTRSDDGVTFIQNVDRASPELAELARQLARRHGWYRPWFDMVETKRGSSGGIGSHFDDSDNFVLQQSGRKRWLLHPPSELTSDELARRMLEDATVGDGYMPDDALELELEPGDLLYIPIFWIHWGMSESDSLSLSLVCNTTNVARSLLDPLAGMLRARRDFWEPLPRFVDVAEAAAMFDRMWAVLTCDQTREAARARWLADTLQAQPPIQHERTVAPSAELVLLDTEAIDELPPARSLAGAPALVHAEPSSASRLARGRISLGRVLEAGMRIRDALGDCEVSATTVELLLALQRCDQPALVDAVLRPELQTWAWRGLESVGFRQRSWIERTAAMLPALLLPSLLRAGQSRLAGVRLVPSAADGLILPRLGLRWRLDGPLPETVRAELIGHDLRLELSGRDAVLRWDPIAEVATASCGRLESLPRISGGPVVVDEHRWFQGWMPGRSARHGDEPLPAELTISSLHHGTWLADLALVCRRPRDTRSWRRPPWWALIGVGLLGPGSSLIAAAARARLGAALDAGVTPASWRGPAALTSPLDGSLCAPMDLLLDAWTEAHEPRRSPAGKAGCHAALDLLRDHAESEAAAPWLELLTRAMDNLDQALEV